MTATQLSPFVKLLGLLCYVMAITYLMDQFFAVALLQYTYSFIGAILLLSTLFYIENKNKLIVFTLLLVGAVSFYVEKIPLSTAIFGFGANTNLMTLFLLIPLIGTFMSTAGYLSALKERVQEKEKSGRQHPYRLSYLLTATMGVILNYGSMAIVKRIAEESFSSYQDKRLTLTIMRAFGFCVLWSPYFVNIGLVLVLFELSWGDIGGYGLILASIYLLVSWLMFRFISFKNDELVKEEFQSTEVVERKSLVPLVCFSTILVMLSFLLEYLMPVNMLTVVSFLAVILPIIWALGTRIFRSYVQDVVIQVQHSFFKIKNELAVFISAGFFGMALSSTEVGTFVSSVLFQLSLGSVFLVSLLIVLLIILLAQFGIHPVIVVIGIGSSLSPLKFGVSHEYMAMVLIIAWTTATQMSPFSGQVLMASHLMKTSPTVVIKENYKFALLLAGLLTTVIYGFYVIGFI